MNIKELSITGCFLITPDIQKDQRGSFVKTYHAGSLSEFGLNINLQEEFYSISKKNVLRGLHFQDHPSAHKKIVYCPEGRVLDFFVDIRLGSPTYGQHLKVELSGTNGVILFLPIGIAHGFLSLENDSLMIYKTDCTYDPDNDRGINFESCDIPLPIQKSSLIVSPRDLGLIALSDFESKFKYE